MKKLVMVALAGLVLNSLAQAQDIPPGVTLPVTQQYVNSPSASQYPGANALYLSDDVTFHADADGTNWYDEHDVIKVFTPAGNEEHRDLVRIYRSDVEKVEVKTVRTILPDGRVVEVAPQSITDEPVFKPEDTKLQSNLRRVQVHFPAVAVNCIVEFHVRTTHKPNPGGKWWAVSYTQNSDPMLESRFTLEVPEGSQSRSMTPGQTLKPEVTRSGGWERTVWTTRNVPALEQAAAGPGVLTQMNRIEVSNYESWADVRNWFDMVTQSKVETTGPVAARVAELVGDKTSPIDKLEAIASWANKKKFLGGALDDYRPYGAAQLVDEPVCTPADACVLLTSMLRAAGFTVEPALAFELPPSEMGTVLPRFNRVDDILLRVTSGAQSWWLSPRHPMEWSAYAPSGLQGGSVLLAGGGGFTALAPSVADDNLVETNVDARLDERGKLELRFHTTEHGASGSAYREASRELLDSGKDEREQSLTALFDRMARNYSARARVLDRYFALDARQGEPIDFGATLSLPDYAVRLGDKVALPLPVRLNAQLTNLASEEGARQQPVRLEHPWREESRLRLHLPAGYTVKELPPTTQLTCPYGSYFCTARSEGTDVFYYSRLNVDTTFVPVSGAPSLTAWARQVLEARSKPVVLNAPSAAATNP